ncbi:DUF2213 domain-containing protein [Erwinia sp. HR93]|uniref:DUF2213 domain-containing protein n=1 Tax=Erwinia sp. HR93 TaxID=3094840 RepID=UPI002ADED278|nr:DUF2213 domain-containing protein [Erwinia sp. HR93]MEA1064738.1 DUF2213 domain-containing protein [Erwinia sp. HR93]
MKHFFALDAVFSQRKKTPQGFLSVPCRIARTGVQEYYRREFGLDGNPNEVIKVYRPPDEVFATDALASFDGVPITNDHPRELVTADNWKKYAIGHVSNPRRDGDYVAADLLFTDKTAIDAIERGEKGELSGGYEFEFDFEYQYPQGVAADTAQTTIRGNHVALVRKGRAGPTVRVSDHSPEGKHLMKIAIDGIPFEMEEQAAAAVEKLIGQVGDSSQKLAAADQEIASLKKEVADLKAKSSDEALEQRATELAAEKTDRSRLAELAKDAAAGSVIKAVIGDKKAEDADISAVRTALRVLDAQGVKGKQGQQKKATDTQPDNFGKAFTQANDAEKTVSARDSYINGFERSAK